MNKKGSSAVILLVILLILIIAVGIWFWKTSNDFRAYQKVVPAPAWGDGGTTSAATTSIPTAPAQDSSK